MYIYAYDFSDADAVEAWRRGPPERQRVDTIHISIVGRFCQKKKVKTVLLSFHQKKSRKESCCYNAKEIAKNNSSVGLWRKKKTLVLLKSKLEEKQIKPYTLERSNHGCHNKNWTT